MPNLYESYEVTYPSPERPSWEKVYLQFANVLSSRGTCKRASVGCVITSEDHSRVLSIGYNGNYRRGPHVCDTDKPGSCGCLHAEENAIIKLNYNDTTYKKLYTTTSPCLMCAKRIINANIPMVTFSELYRKTEGIELLQKNNVFVVQSLS